MDEQLETSSVRVKDAAVSLAEKRPRRGPLFLAVSHRFLVPMVWAGRGAKFYTLKGELRIPLLGRFGRFFLSLFQQKNSSALRRGIDIPNG